MNTVYVIHPQISEVEDWLRDNVRKQAWSMTVVDHRYMDDLSQALQEAGFVPGKDYIVE